MIAADASMKYRLTIDFERTQGPPPSLWDIAHHADSFIALALADLKPETVTRFCLCRLQGPPIEAAIEACREIDIGEFLPTS